VTGLLDQHAHDLDQRIADLVALRTEVGRLRARGHAGSGGVRR